MSNRPPWAGKASYRGAMGYEIQVAIDSKNPHEQAKWWAIADPDKPGSPRVLFQAAPEPKSVKNRLHFDIRVGCERETVAQKLVDAGASICHRGQVGPSVWITMTEPVGNEFCVPFVSGMDCVRD